ncbi:hypothetical protein, partial [Lentilactobacillus hilgardii]|uniref:hypothetical protein n=1 Tax=Lentilactobacillus hilgardii TaxID=1588 RepID=UPI0039EB8690
QRCFYSCFHMMVQDTGGGDNKILYYKGLEQKVPILCQRNFIFLIKTENQQQKFLPFSLI